MGLEKKKSQKQCKILKNSKIYELQQYKEYNNIT